MFSFVVQLSYSQYITRPALMGQIPLRQHILKAFRLYVRRKSDLPLYIGQIHAFWFHSDIASVLLYFIFFDTRAPFAVLSW